MKPRISVCIPTMNRLSMLKEAVASVINNGFPDFEIVISDDGASRMVASYVRSLKDPRIRYYAHKCTGISDNWSNAVKHAAAPLVMKLDDDDLLLPGFLGACVAFMREHPSAAMVFAAHEIRYYNGKVRPMIDRDLFRDRDLVPGFEYGYSILMNKKRPLNHKSAGVYRTRLLRKINYFDTITVDVFSTVAMATLGDIGYLNRIMFVYRHHDKGNEGMSWRPLQMGIDSLPKLFDFSWVKRSPEWVSIKDAAIATTRMTLIFMYLSNLKKWGLKKEMTGFHDRIAAWYPEIAASADYRIFYFFVLHLPRGIVRMIYTSYSRSVVLKSLVGFVIRMVKRRK